MRTRLVLALAALLTVALVPAAAARPWKRLTTPDGASTDQVALARTADGVLHVVWSHPTGPNTEDLRHTAVSRGGTIRRSTPVQSGWTGFTNAALVVEPAGLRVFWGGFRSTDTSDPQRETNTALSIDGGASWALQPGSVVPGGAQSYGSPHAATVRPDGTTLQAFAGTLGTWVHAGLSPLTPNHDYQAPLGQYGYDPNLATDDSGRTVLAWFSSGERRHGVVVQDVGADGAPAGAPRTMPGTGGMTIGMIGRTPLVARPGGGLFVVYTAGTGRDQIRLWRVGRPTSRLIRRLKGRASPAATVAAARDGRIWVLWTKGFGDPDVLATRSNADVTRFGAVVNAGHPKSGLEAYDVDASAAGGALDVLGNWNIGTTTTAVTSYKRILPGLTLRAGVGRKVAKGLRRVRFTVTDAGDPVKGAKVSVGGRRATTDADGEAVIRATTGRSHVARATRSGYTGASKRFRVRG
jgi:hypothetical protein